jgi:hypothetical protein
MKKGILIAIGIASVAGLGVLAYFIFKKPGSGQYDILQSAIKSGQSQPTKTDYINLVLNMPDGDQKMVALKQLETEGIVTAEEYKLLLHYFNYKRRYSPFGTSYTVWEPLYRLAITRFNLPA